jgi:hypothetical protein
LEDESKKFTGNFMKKDFNKELTLKKKTLKEDFTHQVLDLKRKFKKDNNNDDMISRKQKK